MKRILMLGIVGITLAGGGWVAAQSAGPGAKPHAGAAGGGGPGHVHAAAGGGMGMCPMMGGMGMGMGMGMNPMMGGMGMGAMMGGADTRVEVKNVDKGVTITLTSNDAAAVKRLQKMAEAMRLMHEAMAQ
jgi:hypothetical protein